MLARSTPRETYRRIDFDARVAGADAAQLVALCFEQLIAALGSALHGARIGDNALRSQGLTRAISALTALQLGVDRSAAVAPALLQFYEAARLALLESVPAFNADRIRKVRDDCEHVAQALNKAAPPTQVVRE